MLKISSSKDPADRFNFLVGEVNSLSGVVVSHGAQISMLTDELMATKASHAEEMDGRINTENLNHLMILGGPFIEADDLQARLVQQVCLKQFLSIHLHFS